MAVRMTRLDLLMDPAYHPSTKIRKPKPKSQIPPARCPECGKEVDKWTRHDGESIFTCTVDCKWWGPLDASCDCCDAPMEPTGPVIAFGIETYACPACRSVEY